MDFLKRKGCIPLPAEDWSYQFAGALVRLFLLLGVSRGISGASRVWAAMHFVRWAKALLQV